MANSAQPVCVLALQRRNKSELGPLRTATGSPSSLGEECGLPRLQHSLKLSVPTHNDPKGRSKLAFKHHLGVRVHLKVVDLYVAPVVDRFHYEQPSHNEAHGSTGSCLPWPLRLIDPVAVLMVPRAGRSGWDVLDLGSCVTCTPPRAIAADGLTQEESGGYGRRMLDSPPYPPMRTRRGSAAAG